MSKNTEDGWLDNLSQHYRWPNPTPLLKNKILNSIRPHKKVRVDYLAILSNFIPRWEPALALAFTLVLGIYTGALITPSTTASSNSNIYIDADIAFMQTMLKQEGNTYD